MTTTKGSTTMENLHPLPSIEGRCVITPRLAATWLEQRNTNNRPMRKAYVASLARDMANGRWIDVRGTISFTRKGVLADGQHRLAAIVASDTAQAFTVVLNLPEDAIKVIDTGAKRSVGDALALDGSWDSGTERMAAAVARIGFLMDAGQYAANAKPTASEMTDWALAHPDIKQHVRYAMSNSRAFDMPPAVIGYASWRLAQIDVFEAGAFFDDWRELRTSGKGDPLAALIQRFRSATMNSEKVPRPAYLAAIFRTWNARRAGQPLGRLMLSYRQGIIEIPEPK